MHQLRQLQVKELWRDRLRKAFEFCDRDDEQTGAKIVLRALEEEQFRGVLQTA